tara:strand:+ start:152 stop:568 length:417 start_codon:yes stop_codon:yes gene_type:complete
MKALLIIALLAMPVYSATNEELEAQISALQSTLERQKADSTAAVYGSLVQNDADYATLKGAGVTIVNQPHTNGNYDHVWIGVNFPLSEADEATTVKINLALSLLKTQHRAQDCDIDGRVRLRKDRLLAADETLKTIFD